MKAVLFDGKGGPEIVRFADTTDPSPARGEVLVRVRAAALNRADLLQRRGLYPPPPGTREDIPASSSRARSPRPARALPRGRPAIA